MRLCSKCKLDPARDKHSWCKECLLQSAKNWRQEYKTRTTPDQRSRQNKSYMLKTKYQMTLEEYEARLHVQGYQCKVCNTSEPGRPAKVFAVDHDHVTGAIRGLLCNSCNLALGLFDDSTELLNKAINYLTVK